MSERSSLQLRAQDIINHHPNGITAREALKQAAIERYGNDPDKLAEAFASAASSAMSILRKKTYELPDNSDALFQIPSFIAVRSEGTDLYVHRNEASLGHVRQWRREAQQYFSTQLLRSKRAKRQLDQLRDEPDDLNWQDARKMLNPADEDQEQDDE